jgi:hypothetical protein
MELHLLLTAYHIAQECSNETSSSLTAVEYRMEHASQFHITFMDLT